MIPAVLHGIGNKKRTKKARTSNGDVQIEVNAEVLVRIHESDAEGGGACANSWGKTGSRIQDWKHSTVKMNWNASVDDGDHVHGSLSNPGYVRIHDPHWKGTRSRAVTCRNPVNVGGGDAVVALDEDVVVGDDVGVDDAEMRAIQSGARTTVQAVGIPDRPRAALARTRTWSHPWAQHLTLGSH